MASAEPEHVRSLREAARLSPENLPLRQALADALLGAGLSAEAVNEYRSALALSPDHALLKLGLARAFHADGKTSHALVVLEDVVKSPEAPGRAFVFHARLLAGVGEVQQAVEQYRRGVAKDRSAADPEFATRFGIRLAPEPESERESAPSFVPDGDEDEVSEGRVRATWQGSDSDAPAVFP
jgi:transitional endoplasmic reticulum ATPase